MSTVVMNVRCIWVKQTPLTVPISLHLITVRHSEPPNKMSLTKVKCYVILDIIIIYSCFERSHLDKAKE